MDIIQPYFEIIKEVTCESQKEEEKLEEDNYSEIILENI